MGINSILDAKIRGSESQSPPTGNLYEGEWKTELRRSSSPGNGYGSSWGTFNGKVSFEHLCLNFMSTAYCICEEKCVFENVLETSLPWSLLGPFEFCCFLPLKDSWEVDRSIEAFWRIFILSSWVYFRNTVLYVMEFHSWTFRNYGFLEKPANTAPDQLLYSHSFEIRV